MAVPATTGQLRMKLSDMQFGDYIVCNYVASSGASGAFSNLGGTVGTEIPVAGSATPNGSFYLIKVDKGLLVSDRVLQTSISWYTLNAANYIQMCYWNEVPKLTSNTSSSSIVTISQSSNYNGYLGFYAFNKTNTNNGWIANGTSGWLMMDFVVPKTICQYTVSSAYNAAQMSRAPKDWTFEGSNNGVDWTVLDTQTNHVDWSAQQYKKFIIQSPQSFTKYRINITSNNGDAIIEIGEVGVTEVANMLIRSLTGGVAYADINGNYTLIDSSLIYGGFPTNNEWDKYIVNFPTNKIQSGKTLDDVFHYSNLSYGTLTQETISVGININTQRVLRGSNSSNVAGLKGVNYVVSTGAAASYGFRPVFEYKEV